MKSLLSAWIGCSLYSRTIYKTNVNVTCHMNHWLVLTGSIMVKHTKLKLDPSDKKNKLVDIASTYPW